jgi:hypothetical protein
LAAQWEKQVLGSLAGTAAGHLAMVVPESVGSEPADQEKPE